MQKEGDGRAVLLQQRALRRGVAYENEVIGDRWETRVSVFSAEEKNV